MSGVNVIDLGGTDEFKNDPQGQTDTYRSTGEADTAREQSMQAKIQLKIKVENTNVKAVSYQSLVGSGVKKPKMNHISHTQKRTT